MIKLIAVDMDGTLLDSQKRLPEDFPRFLNQLKRAGIRLVIASGRQYYNLKKQLAPYGDQFIYICENGTMIFEKEKPIFLEPFQKEDWQDLVKQLRRIPGACPILCCPENAYCENQEPNFYPNAKMYYERLELVPDLLQIEDPVCKIAVYDLFGAETNSFRRMRECASTSYQITLSGETWIDIMGQSNKGTALTALEKLEGISYEETMAFGDYLNDCEMMDACYYSCAMANAHPILLQHARFLVGSNDENGVLMAAREMLGLEDGIAVREVPYQSEEYRQNLQLRNEVLRLPLGLDLREEDLSVEADFHHLSAIENGQVIGTMMLLPDSEDPHAMRMKQVAVMENRRGRKIGTRMHKLAVQVAKRWGYSAITLHARKTAVDFYRKQGFQVTGSEFLEIGIPHLPMKLEFESHCAKMS
ncbi:MAG: Cof-type HAD-IIB family hydrolase [Candidatus Merdivicinus sp.]